MDSTINVFLTGMPIIWFGIFDWEHPKEDFLSHPSYFKIGLKNRCFNSFLFWRWYFYATWQSILIFWLTFKTFEISIGIHKIETDKDKEYTLVSTETMRLNGVFIVESICILANLKVFVATNRHNFFSFFWIIGSIGAFYVQFYCESNI